LRYAGNGRDRIHFLATDHHPRDLVSNRVYHGYIQFAGREFSVHRSDGTRLGKLSSSSKSAYKASDFTPLTAADAGSPANRRHMTRAWPVDFEIDAAGNPYALFTARVDDQDTDHRFFYGRFAKDKWIVRELARAGGFLYAGENDYTGLAALDPNNINRTFISTNIDPRSHRNLPHYEIFTGITNNEGRSWNWSAVTQNSAVDNLRPIVPRGMGRETMLVWMRGVYHSYTKYNTQIVGLQELEIGERFAVDHQQ
jgi:hypothetical protein